MSDDVQGSDDGPVDTAISGGRKRKMEMEMKTKMKSIIKI